MQNLLNISLTADLNVFFGHFHPVVVHLPIGILVMAGILEVFSMRQKAAQWDKVIALTLLTGCLSAVVSAFLGWLLSLSGEYNESTLALHQWIGISMAIFSGICWYLKVYQSGSKKGIDVYRISLVLMLLLLMITGHLGGTLTHGEGYLTAGLGTAQDIKMVPKRITNIPEARVYQDLVSPVLQTKCWSCHRESKSKGGLRMDNETLLMKGGKDGVVINGFHSAQSELVKRLLLPEGDEHRMPPKGKKHLTDDEIALLKWWIDKGADFAKKVADLKPDPAIVQMLSRLTGSATAGTAEIAFTPAALPAPFNRAIEAADLAAIKELEKLSVIVAPIAQGQNYLSVSCINASGFNDAQLGLALKIAKQITWLQLNHTRVTDAGLATLTKMPNITKLNLAYTMISNESIEVIRKLSNLKCLNLTGTKITDEGLMKLGVLTSLKIIYCWQTKITQQGIATLKKASPDVTVIIGEP